MIRVLETFAGYGGASFALKRVGIAHKIVGYSEIDKHAIQIYEANHPNIPNFGDITEIIPEDLPDFDLLTGGFPCVAFSTIGAHGGETDPRGRLFRDILRICEVKRPKYILMENVKGFLSNRYTETLEALKKGLKDLGYGDVVYALLNSKKYGIPQNRERVWFFAKLGGLSDGFSMTPPEHEPSRLISIVDDVIPTDHYVSQERVDELKQIIGVKSLATDEPVCLDCYNRKIMPDATFSTLTTKVNGKQYIVEGENKVRKLTAMELFKLMGFKDGEIDFGGLKYSHLCIRAGNGWDINIVEQILRHIMSQGELI